MEIGVENVNIWEEGESNELLIIQEEKVKSGSFNKIIERLTSPVFKELKLMHTFSATYRSFTNPSLLFSKLKERWDVPEREEKNKLTIQLRVLNFLKHWCETQFDDLADDSQLLSDLLDFFSQQKNVKAYSSIVSSIINTLESKKINPLQQDLLKQQFVEKIELEPKIPLSPSRILFVFNEEEIAKQLTFIDFSIYTLIQVFFFFLFFFMILNYFFFIIIFLFFFFYF